MNKLFDRPTWEHATYNCPCEKHASVKLTPHHFNVWPCALFMVMLYANFTGNCNLLKQSESSFDIRGILGMNTDFPFSLPTIISASITLFRSCLTHSLVPLHSFGELRFLKSMIGDPTFNLRKCNGIPGAFNEFKNSVGKFTLSFSLTIVSINLYVFSSPCINFWTISLMFSTTSFLVAKIARSHNHSC